ncbi:MAG TPA: 30S ribosomal protein S17e [Methanocellales archaeon]|nr:30S ribosomal protein S17e [Methanocellales archaeon]
MGVKPTYVKSVGNKLIKKYPDVFVADFDENKKHVSEHTNVKSTVIRNRIAGYITIKLKPKKER